MAGKEIVLHDQLIIDGTDYSNLLRDPSLSSENERVDASGMSVSGNDEFLPGKRTQSMTFTMFLTEELRDALWPLHRDRETFSIIYRPHGLVEPGRPAFFGIAVLNTFPWEGSRGEVRTGSITFDAGDEDGFDWSAGS